AAAIGKYSRRSRRLDLRHHAIGVGVHDHYGVAIVGHGEEQVLGAVEYHFAWLAAHLDSASDDWRGAQVQHHDLAVSQARHVTFVVTLEDRPVGIFAAGNAFLGRIMYPRTQLQFSNLLPPAFLHHLH